MAPQCPTEGSGGTITQILYTIEPSTESSMMSIQSDPADLVMVIVEDSSLRFEINEAAAASATAGGVRVMVPPDQLTKISSMSSASVQILPGLTSLEQLEATSSSILNADLSTVTDAMLTISASSSALAFVKAVAVSSVDVQTSATLHLTTESDVSQLLAKSSGKAYVMGNVVESLNVESSGSAYVDGAISATDATVASSGLLYVPSGSAGCDGVELSSSGTCNEADFSVQGISLDDSFLKVGTNQCGSGGGGGDGTSGVLSATSLLSMGLCAIHRLF